LDEELKARVKGYFDKRGIPFLKAHEVQCLMPDKATSLTNNMGTAPGMLFESGSKYVLSMPGVPYEMKYIFDNSFVSVWQKLVTSDTVIKHNSQQDQTRT